MKLNSAWAMLDPIADKLLVGALLITLAWTRDLNAFDLIPAIAIMLREIFVSGLREYLGNRAIEVPVTFLAKWKTTAQLVALACHGCADAARAWLHQPLRAVDRRRAHRVDRLGVPALHLAAPRGTRNMKIKYFAWLRERLNRGEEEVSPPPRW
jgi:hypothetical protein